MGTAERRNEILRILCRRRHETISGLSSEFSVSERTIRRDIEVLSLSYPIYTQTGRYYGGVYILDSFSPERMYMSNAELSVLNKLLASARQQKTLLSKEETEVLQSIILQYTKTQIQKGTGT